MPITPWVATHIVAALAALDHRDVDGARRAVAAARRQLGHYGEQVRSLGAVGVALAVGTRRELIATSLANAADALQGDTWPGDEPDDVAEFLRGPDPDAASPEINAWCQAHEIIRPNVARISLRSALAELSDD